MKSNIPLRVITDPAALLNRTLLDEVCRLHDRTFKEPPSCQNWVWNPDGDDPSVNSHAFFREASQLPGFRAIVATVEEKVVGVAVGAQLTNQKIERLGFHSVGAKPGDGYELVAFVDKEYQGTGLYKRLNLARLRCFRELSLGTVFVRCRMDNSPVLSARKSLGYELVAQNVQVTIGGRTDFRSISRCNPATVLDGVPPELLSDCLAV